MRRFILLLVIPIVFAVLAGCAQSNDAASDDFVNQIIKKYPELKDQPYEKESIERVIDGDTFETTSGSKVRLIGVNTPEVYGGVEFYGREASAFSKEKLNEATVYLFQDVSDTDRYGRLLRYVFIEGDPVMFNETLLKEGYANAMTYPPDVMFSATFTAIEKQAREQEKGLWGDATELNDDPTADDNETGNTDNNTYSCEQPTIKGNINSRGEKIYHMPGGVSYEQTIAEQMFCTEEEAVEAGFRKAMR